MKKRLVYGAIAFIWIVLPASEITLSFVATDIVKGTCIPWGVYSSYAVERAVSTLLLFSGFIFPLMLICFCYARIVYVMRNKVILLWRMLTRSSNMANVFATFVTRNSTPGSIT